MYSIEEIYFKLFNLWECLAFNTVTNSLTVLGFFSDSSDTFKFQLHSFLLETCWTFKRKVTFSCEETCLNDFFTGFTTTTLLKWSFQLHRQIKTSAVVFPTLWLLLCHSTTLYSIHGADLTLGECNNFHHYYFFLYVIKMNTSRSCKSHAQPVVSFP